MTMTMNYAQALRKDMYQRQDTEDMIADAVSKDGMLLQHVKNKTPRIVYQALKQNWRAMQFVDIDNFLARQVVLMDPQAASLLPAEHHLMAVIADIDCFDYIAEPSMDAWRYVIEKNPDWISKKPSPHEAALFAVEMRHNSIVCMSDHMNYFKGIHLTEDLAKASLPITHGYAYLSFPEDLKTALAEETLQVNVTMARFMTLTPALQDAMLRVDGSLIHKIENPTEAQTILACRTTPHALYLIRNPTRATIWESAIGWSDALQYAKEQDEDLCVHAVRHQPYALRHVNTNLNPLIIWQKAGMPLVDVQYIFPQYRAICLSCEIWWFFEQVIVSLLTQVPVSGDLEDPVTLEPVTKGTVVAFLGDHFAGTLPTMLKMLETRFRGSNHLAVFVPMRNALVRTQNLRWGIA